MIFLGTTFCSGKYTLSPPTTKNTTLLTIMIKDGKYNHLFVSLNALKEDTVFEWDESTVMDADFNDSLLAGNKEFNLEKTDHIVISRREVGKKNWVVLYDKEVYGIKDFDIHLVDKYAKAKTNYEYKMSSYLNGVENTTIIENIYSDFGGMYLADKECLYGTIFNLDACDTARQISGNTLELMNSKYANVVSNSETNYDTGTTSGLFVSLENKDYLTLISDGRQREDIKNRLSNKKPLILKIHDGRIWMMKVVGEITDSQDGDSDLRRISFNWAEIGDLNSMKDLYGYNFVDVDSRWW